MHDNRVLITRESLRGVAYLLYFGFSFYIKPIATVKVLKVCTDNYSYMVLLVRI